jgi:hypothetical protein
MMDPNSGPNRPTLDLTSSVTTNKKKAALLQTQGISVSYNETPSQGLHQIDPILSYGKHSPHLE